MQFWHMKYVISFILKYICETDNKLYKFLWKDVRYKCYYFLKVRMSNRLLLQFFFKVRMLNRYVNYCYKFFKAPMLDRYVNCLLSDFKKYLR